MAVYGLSVIDAYVDASLSEFDISDNLSMRIEPTFINNSSGRNPLQSGGMGVQCSPEFLNFIINERIQFLISLMLIAFPAFIDAQEDNTKKNNAEVVETVDEDAEAVEPDDSVDIDMPEAMTADVDSLLHLYNTKTYLQPDVNCDFPNVNPTYEPEVYKERLRKLPTVIEMPYNPVVQRFIDSYRKTKTVCEYNVGSI